MAGPETFCPVSAGHGGTASKGGTGLGHGAGAQAVLLPEVSILRLGADDLEGGKALVSDPIVELADRHRSWALGYMRRLRIPPEDSADLWQSALLRAWQRWEELRHPEHWFRGLIRKLCIVYWRERRRSRESSAGGLLELVETLDMAEEARAGLLAVDVERYLDRLSARKAELVWRRYGLSQKPVEIATAMGMKVSSVRTMARRGLREVSVLAVTTVGHREELALKWLSGQRLGPDRPESLAGRCHWLDTIDGALQRGAPAEAVEALTGVSVGE